MKPRVASSVAESKRFNYRRQTARARDASDAVELKEVSLRGYIRVFL